MRKTSLRSIALALCVALQLAISALSGPALAAISLPSGCTITASPESSATNVLVAGTQVNLTGSCASGDGPIRFIWSAGGGETIRPTTTASYAAVPFNDAGSGIPAFVTVYTGVSGALSAPSGCSITQTPDTRFKPPAPGSTISLRAFCVEGGAATACNWSDPTLGSSCRVSVVAIDQSTSVSATPFNAAGSAAPITTQITGSSNVINSSSEVVIVRANAMVNGSPLKEPQFVGAGDVITFDTVLQSMPLGTGLGLCLEFSRSFGVVKLHNIYSDGYVGGGTAAQYLERYFCDRRSITVPGADSTIIVPWAHFTGYWPDVPTPLKLYDVEVTVGLNVRAASYVGFGASALPSLATLRVEQPLLLCPKSTVVVSQAAVSASQVAFNLLLSAAVSGACGVNGTLPVVLEVVTPSARAIGVTGSGVSLNGQSLTVPVPADGRTTAVPFTVSFSQPIDPAFTAKIVQLIATGGNYDDGGTSIAAPVVPLVPGNVGFGIGGGGIINFSPGAPGIAVSKSGRGDGKVTSSVGNIQCPPDCTAYYGSGTSVTLTAIPGAGSQFAGWLSDCIGRANTCTVSVNRQMQVSAMFAPDTSALTSDVDGNGTYDALSDGLLIIRALLGMTTNDLTNGVLPQVTTALLERLIDIRPILDIDGNGQVDALTDGLLLQRYLFGMRGAALIANVVAGNATRTTAGDIEGYVRTILP